MTLHRTLHNFLLYFSLLKKEEPKIERERPLVQTPTFSASCTLQIVGFFLKYIHKSCHFENKASDYIQQKITMYIEVYNIERIFQKMHFSFSSHLSLNFSRYEWKMFLQKKAALCIFSSNTFMWRKKAFLKSILTQTFHVNASKWKIF